MRWSEADKKRVRAILDHITAAKGQAAFAQRHNITSRATVNNWRRRGRVPVDHIELVIRAARQTKPSLRVEAAMLHPDARVVQKLAPKVRRQPA